MKKLYNAALVYLILGLSAGVVYREVTRWMEFDGVTRLSLLHTHLLTLGVLVFLIALILEKQFALSRTKWFNLFYWHYNAGLMLTIALMTYIGVQQMNGDYSPSGMIAGISGIGHILLAAGFGFLFAALHNRLQHEPAVGTKKS